MSYIDDFVIPCPTDKKQAFIDHARSIDTMFLEMGALRIVECWGDDIPDGKTTDFKMAVKAETGESVAFSWIEWPDKDTRDKAMAKLDAMMADPDNGDPRMDPEQNPVPFDGKRMIFGGFEPIVDLSA